MIAGYDWAGEFGLREPHGHHRCAAPRRRRGVRQTEILAAERRIAGSPAFQGWVTWRQRFGRRGATNDVGAYGQCQEDFEMANTYTALHYHFVFSTKGRRAWIRPDIEERVWKYFGGIARTNKMTPIRTGGIDDHIHLLLGAPPTIAPSKIAQLVKGGSSAWIHETFADLAEFAWQDGYGAFTVSKSSISDVIAYIENQREHHRSRTFQEEYRALLDRHGIEYDERYVWD